MSPVPAPLAGSQRGDRRPGGRAPGRRRFTLTGWGAFSLAVAGLIAVPLLTLPASFLSPRPEIWSHLLATILPEVVVNTAVLAVGVAAGTLLLGAALAVLVTFYDFPGRRFLEWALILPLAMPAYVLTFVLLSQWEFASPIQTFLRAQFGPGFALPELRSAWGAIAILTLVLYPYVYLLGRAAFLTQASTSVDAARSLGASHLGAILRVALPIARPGLAAGTALAVMEALADFGSVSLLAYRTFTETIYRTWYGFFDREAAIQLAFLLLTVTLGILALERYLRGRARYHESLSRGTVPQPARLRGLPAALALGLPLLLLGLAFFAPAAQLVGWSIHALERGLLSSNFLVLARNSFVLAAVTAALAVATATALVFGLRVAPSALVNAAVRFASIGYGLPGSVVAVGVIIPLAWLDRSLNLLTDQWFGVTVGLILTGSAVGLVFAYLVRFLAVAFSAVEAQMTKIPPTLDGAARSLGAGPARLLRRVHLPLLRTGLLTAVLLVFVDVLKELPATALLRPFGWDTLAVAVWQATSDSLWATAAPPALAILAVGLVPVIVLVRLSAARGTRQGAPRGAGHGRG